jgi:hypothetical protein
VTFRAKASGAQPKALKENQSFRGRGNPTTPVNPVNTCGHPGAIVRSVATLNGAAAYLCRNCFARLRAVEVRAVLVSQWNNLWRLRPRLNRAGGALEVSR